jgi:hypothetical protein
MPWVAAWHVGRVSCPIIGDALMPRGSSWEVLAGGAWRGRLAWENGTEWRQKLVRQARLRCWVATTRCASDSGATHGDCIGLLAVQLGAIPMRPTPACSPGRGRCTRARAGAKRSFGGAQLSGTSTRETLECRPDEHLTAGHDSH